MRVQGDLGAFTFQSDDFARRIHDGRIGSDRPFDRIIRVGHVDDDDVGGVVNFFSNTDELIWFHGKWTEADVRHVDANIL